MPPTTLDPAELRAADDFDAAYADAMIAHHEKAIRMAAVGAPRRVFMPSCAA